MTAARREGWLSRVGRWLITGQSGAGIWGGVIPGPDFPGPPPFVPAPREPRER